MIQKKKTISRNQIPFCKYYTSIWLWHQDQIEENEYKGWDVENASLFEGRMCFEPVGKRIFQ